MPNNDACVGQSPLTSEVPKDRVMVISLMVGCWRTWAEMGIVWMEKGSVRLVMLMINYASVERLGRRQRQSWICDMEHNSWSSNITSCTLPFSVQTISISAWVLQHPTICKITLTLSSALHLSTDSIQHMYTHQRSQITVMHRAHTICSVFLVICLSHHSTCYFLLFHMSLINLPHARCPSLPVMFHLLSI